MARMQSCPNVVQLLTAFEDQDCLYIVTDLCRGGDLERVLQVLLLPPEFLLWS